MRYDSVFKTDCIKDYLGKLSVGFWVNGRHLKKFRLHPYTTEHEFLLLEFYSQEENFDFEEMCCTFIPQIVESVEGFSFKEIAESQGLSSYRLVQEMFFGDVLLILLNIRFSTGGLKVAFGDICPACGTENKDNPDLDIYHSLEAIDITSFEKNIRSLSIQLVDGIYLSETITFTVQMNPLGFSQFLNEYAEYPYVLQFRIPVISLSAKDEQGNTVSGYPVFELIRTVRDRNVVLGAAKEYLKLGPEMEMPVEMFCQKCDYEWQSWMTYQSMLSFYKELLRPPPEKHLNDILFFLTFGEQSPCKSINEVKKLSVRERDALVNKLSDAYESQKKDMEKSSKKGNSTKRSY
jgi:hypothetical protein